MKLEEFSPYGLLGNWRANGGTSTTMYDSSQYANNGDIDGASWVAGKRLKNALSFDGTDDYVDCGTNARYNFTSEDFSIEFIVKIAEARSHWLFNRGGFNADGYYVNILAAGTVRIRFNQSGAGQAQLSNAVITDTTAWYHVIITRTGATVKIYIDGVDETGSAVALTDPASSTKTIWFGRNHAGTTFFKGILDELRIYNRVLNSQEIARHYTASKVILPQKNKKLKL